MTDTPRSLDPEELIAHTGWMRSLARGLVRDEATVKRYYPERDYIRFQPENESMAPILVRSTDFKPTMLLGVVVGVYRRL